VARNIAPLNGYRTTQQRQRAVRRASLETL
jgi:hypothetical protein